jgi:hypothetical protein
MRSADSVTMRMVHTRADETEGDRMTQRQDTTSSTRLRKRTVHLRREGAGRKKRDGQYAWTRVDTGGERYAYGDGEEWEEERWMKLHRGAWTP